MASANTANTANTANSANSANSANTANSATRRVDLALGLTREFLSHHGVCPVGVDDDGALVVFTVGRSFTSALPELAHVYARRVVTEVVTEPELERMIERLAAVSERALSLTEPEPSTHHDDEELGADVRELANQPPVIRYVNLLVRDAHDAGASDIHLEAQHRGTLSARFRLDGVLVEGPPPPAALAHAIFSRIKLLAEMDTAERRRPQDGRIRVRLESRELDLRVSTVPTLFGESVVIRLLDQGGRPVQLEELGMGAEDLLATQKLAERAHGLLLVTGPTGSGKTTTLYAALGKRAVASEKIITVEDPIEYQLDGVAQVPVHRQVGVTMSSALRAILRQDPDVIMVGEMRDSETAEVAIQAAMTGHLVFSTLHTTDAVGAIPRLLDLGVPDYLVAATLDGVLAQRLVRRICDACRIQYAPDPEHVALVSSRPVGKVVLTRGVGCAVCRGTGYRGRTGLFELLVVSDEIKDAIACGARRSSIAELAAGQGMRSLRSDGWIKVQAGQTTVEEVLRVSTD